MLRLQTHVFSSLKDGATIREVYLGAVQYIQQNKPDLAQHFLKNLGFAVRSLSLLSDSRMLTRC